MMESKLTIYEAKLSLLSKPLGLKLLPFLRLLHQLLLVDDFRLLRWRFPLSKVSHSLNLWDLNLCGGQLLRVHLLSHHRLLLS